MRAPRIVFRIAGGALHLADAAKQDRTGRDGGSRTGNGEHPPAASGVLAVA